VTETETSDTISLFYCYNQDDKELRNVLEKHLKALRRLDYLEDSSDLNISAGAKRDQIKATINFYACFS
jgi:hypothetical protein